MQHPVEPSALSGVFQRIVDDLQHDAEFSDVEVVTARAQRGRDGFALSIMLAKPAGVDIRTCERVAARINLELQDLSEPYTLEVESAGLNRPLFAPRDYERFSGESVRVISNLSICGAKTHRGKLSGLRGTSVVLQTAGGEVLIPLEIVKSANIEFDIRADLQRAKRTKNAQKDV